MYGKQLQLALTAAFLATASYSMQCRWGKQKIQQKYLQRVQFQEFGIVTGKCNLCLMLDRLNSMWAVAKQHLEVSVIPRKCPDTGADANTALDYATSCHSKRGIVLLILAETPLGLSKGQICLSFLERLPNTTDYLGGQ